MFPNGIFSQYPLDFLIENLGIDVSTFEGRLLDVCCGEDARLVEYLRTRYHIPAEGIDATLKKTASYLKRAEIPPLPYADDRYQLVVSHMGLFRDGTKFQRGMMVAMSDEACVNSIYQRIRTTLLNFVTEALRVARPGKPFVVSPSPDYFLEREAKELARRGVSFERVRCPHERDFPDEVRFGVDDESPDVLTTEEFFYRTEFRLG